uniref:Uncharacterized protein n=1 Tax=Heliothis virescens TaxID=7102 RepID=A0A2A4IX33_HELVI
MWSLGALPDGFPAAYAAYAAGRSYSGYPSFGLPYPAGNPLASLHHQLSGNHYHHLATLLPYHPLELSGVYYNFVETIRPIASASLHVYRRFALTILKCYASSKQTLVQTPTRLRRGSGASDLAPALRY